MRLRCFAAQFQPAPKRFPIPTWPAGSPTWSLLPRSPRRATSARFGPATTAAASTKPTAASMQTGALTAMAAESSAWKEPTHHKRSEYTFPLPPPAGWSGGTLDTHWTYTGPIDPLNPVFLGRRAYPKLESQVQNLPQRGAKGAKVMGIQPSLALQPPGRRSGE